MKNKTQQQQQRQFFFNNTKQEQIKMGVFINFSKHMTVKYKNKQT